MILITGSNGEIGQALIKKLYARNIKNILALDLEEPDKKTNINQFIKGSILDKELLHSINKKYNATFTHAILAWKDKDKRFEWWQIQDVEIGDKVVNTKLELEEVTSIKKIEKELEVVSVGLRKYNVFFANGYMNHD